ncbi:MAG TPA: RimK/LysX family protein [Bdellovibrionota bacterium]|jgi:hypothetical protein|nr:RimK/LysX family protein [Bdellovibrionota bacterium]
MGSKVIGWREWVGLPEWGIALLLAKMDTGARTSAVHATDVKHIVVGGKKRVRFRVHPSRRNLDRAVLVEADLVDVRRVKSSSGAVTERPVVRTRMSLAGVQWDVEVTLVDRAPMGYRMLVGRAALSGHFVVDPGVSYVAGRVRDLRAGSSATRKTRET